MTNPPTPSAEVLIRRLSDPYRHQWTGAMIANTCDEVITLLRTLAQPKSETCSYCGVEYPAPISYHHDTEECDRNIATAQPKQQGGCDDSAAKSCDR